MPPHQNQSHYTHCLLLEQKLHMCVNMIDPEKVKGGIKLEMLQHLMQKQNMYNVVI